MATGTSKAKKSAAQGRARGASPSSSKNPPRAATEIAGKSIILFSDGTGNSSAKVFKTNVWRMYEAVDLGPSPSGLRDQISFYDDGVGTSNFRLLASFGGAFGWGLKRNVLDLYRFACRNYRKGDRIYAFGFSRGAFTIRLAIAMIATQGLVESTDESDLDRKSRAAFRAFRKSYLPRHFRRPTESARRMRDFKADYDPSRNVPATIAFVGVWDTVAAYGGPIAEITRAIDNWFYPLSMPDYELHEKVECARHALALDDERDAFWPLLWDEVVEEQRAEAAKASRLLVEQQARQAKNDKDRKRLESEVQGWKDLEDKYRNRLQQVWFTGMHADVGGGYPDESLSYVSLLWMMEEAEDAGLRILPTIKDRYIALANSYGPMHNSRVGFGAYYRYQPRKIAVWQESADERDRTRYLMLRDPDVVGPGKRSRGLLREVRIHESVIARIHSNVVRYAPLALPKSFKIMPPQTEGENVAQPTEPGTLKCRYDRPPSEPLISRELRERIEREAPDRFARQENLFDFVWRRRITYFATVAVTLLLVALPLWNPLPSFVDRTCADSRCVFPSLVRAAEMVVPGFAAPWIEALAHAPYTAVIFLALIVGLLWRSSWLERRLWDSSFHLWRATLDGRPIEPVKESRFRKFREGLAYQTAFRGLRWTILPGAVGLLMAAALLYVPLIGVSQIMIQVKEANHGFCAAGSPSALRRFSRATFDFNTRHSCNNPRLLLEPDQVYEITFQFPVTEGGEAVGWWDDGVASKPGTLTRVRASNLWQVLGVPMRRVIEASYLQPLVQTTNYRNEDNSSASHITKLNLKRDEDWPELYRARFQTAKDFESSFHLFANDAYVPLFGRRWTYANNCGTARVTIVKVAQRGASTDLMEDPGPPVPIAECARRKLEAENSKSGNKPLAT